METYLILAILSAGVIAAIAAWPLLRPSGEPRIFDDTVAYGSPTGQDSLLGRSVLRCWMRDLDVLDREGRIFMIPGRGHVVKLDDVETWEPYALGIPHKRLTLRVIHHDPMRDLDYDAVALAFKTAAGKEEFLSRVPAEGPVPFVFADTLSAGTRRLHDRLMAR